MNDGHGANGHEVSQFIKVNLQSIYQNHRNILKTDQLRVKNGECDKTIFY